MFFGAGIREENTSPSVAKRRSNRFCAACESGEVDDCRMPASALTNGEAASETAAATAPDRDVTTVVEQSLDAGVGAGVGVGCGWIGWHIFLSSF